MKEKFTPGPWEVVETFNVTTKDKTEYKRGRGVCSTGSFYSSLNTDKVHTANYANAHLIAAAPCLYDALNKSLAAFKDIQEDGQPRGVSVGWLIEHLEEALKRARGEA